MVDAVTNLFREIYADICMLYLPDMLSPYYINLVTYGLPEDRADEVMEYYAIRIYLSLEIYGKPIPKPGRDLNDQLIRDLLQEAEMLKNQRFQNNAG